MSLVPFLAVAFGAAAAALVARGYRRLSLAIGLLGLIAATIAALAIVPGDRLGVGPGRLEATEFGRLFLALGCSTGLIIALIGLATAWQRNLPAALLGGFGAIGLALAIGDSITALMAILAGALVGSLVTIVRPITASNVQVASREFRALAVAGAIAIVGMAWIARPLGPLAEEPTVFGVAYMAVALAAAIRFGAIPFHRWAARLSESAPEIALPLLLAWAPAAFAVVALAWTDRSIAPLLLPLQVERSVVLTVGVLSIVLGAVAAWLQDDLEHIVGYSIVQDAGFVILGLAILDPIAWQPTRTWILVFVVVKTAFAAWAVAVRTRFRTGSLPELGGWARRSPGLGLGLLLIVIATLGVPGLVAWEVRSRLVDLSITTGPLRLLVIFGGLASLGYYGRIALAGLRPPSILVLAGATERPRRAVTVDGSDASELVTDGVAMAAMDRGSTGTTGSTGSGDVAHGSSVDPDPPRRPGRWSPRPAGGALTRFESTGASIWRANRAPIASAGVLVLALTALAVGVGGLGGPAAAAAPAPEPVAPTETFVPGQTEPASPAPSESRAPDESGAPSFAPIPTASTGGSGSPDGSAPPTEVASPSSDATPTPSPTTTSAPSPSSSLAPTPSPS